MDATGRTGATTGRTGATRLVSKPSDNRQKRARERALGDEGKKKEPPKAPPTPFMKAHPELFGLQAVPGSGARR
jgi:hypothetical protein